MARLHTEPPLEQVGGILQNYANRGLFRGFSPGAMSSSRAVFKMVWHLEQRFELIVDLGRNTLRVPVVLPAAPLEIYREFKRFVESRQSAGLPEHRRIDPAKAAVRCSSRGGNVSLTVTVGDGGYEYAARKLIHLIHETYLDFLLDAKCYDYRIETFNLDPDKM